MTRAYVWSGTEQEARALLAATAAHCVDTRDQSPNHAARCPAHGLLRDTRALAYLLFVRRHLVPAVRREDAAARLKETQHHVF